MNYLAEAYAAYSQGNLDEAYLLSQQATTAEPGSAEAYALWGKVCQARLNYEEALKHYQKAAELEPGKAVYRYQVANALMLQGEYKQAEALYRQVLDSEINDPWLFCNLGRALLYQNRIEEAADFLQKAVEADPQLAEAQCSLGRTFTKQNRFEAANLYYQKAIELEPGQFIYHHDYGDNLLLQGNYQAAVAAYRRTAELNSSYVWTHWNLGRALLQLEEWNDAVTALQEAIRLGSDSAEVYIGLGYAFSKQQKWEEAIGTYQTAVKTHSNDAVLYRELGVAQERIGDAPGAIVSFRKVIELEPQQPAWIYETLLKLVYHQKNLEEAIAIGQQGAEQHPGEVSLREYLHTLQQEAQMTSGLNFLIEQMDYSAEIPSLNEWNRQLEPVEGTSIFTCCMNRNSNLRKAVQTWLRCRGIDEIVIVDWSSDEPVSSSLSDIADSRIVIVRVVNQEKWILSHAFNLAARLTTRSRILKLDADIEISPDFLERNILREGGFLAGNWRLTQADQAYINGCFFLHRSTYFNVNGFNEWITTYGWDDTDLYQRLEERGYQRLDLVPETLNHMKHTDEDRLVHQFRTSGKYGYDQLRQSPSFNNQKNRFIALMMPDWNQDRQMLDFKLTSQKTEHEGIGKQFICKQSHESYHQVPVFTMQDAEDYAARELLCWRLGFGALALDHAKLEYLLRTRKFESISRFDLFLTNYVNLSENKCAYSVIIQQAALNEDQLIYCLYILLGLTNKVAKNLCIREGLVNDKIREFIRFLANPRLIILPDWYPDQNSMRQISSKNIRMDTSVLSVSENLILDLDEETIGKLASQNLLDNESRKFLFKYPQGERQLKFLAYEDLKYRPTLYEVSLQTAQKVEDIIGKLEYVKRAIRFAPFQEPLECFISVCEALGPYVEQKIDESSKFRDWLWSELEAYSKPVVTIVTSMFKGDEYIEHFLEDITRQTMFGRCELIIINPNSPGNEEPVIKRYMERYRNIRYERLDHDPGLYDSWNMAIMMGSGEYVTNANLDDRRAPQHLEVLVSALDEHPDVDVASSALYVTYGKNEFWENSSAHDIWFVGFPKFYDVNSLFVEQNGKIESQNIAHCMPVWRRQLHNKFGYFDEHTYGTSCDWEFWLRCASQGTNFMLIDEPLGLYLENPTSHNRRFSNKEKLEQQIADRYCRLLQKDMAICPHSYTLDLGKMMQHSSGLKSQKAVS